MKKLIVRLFIFLIPAFFIACSSPAHKKDLGDIIPGKLMEKVNCENDTTIQFALYLPSDYTDEKAYPLIFIFDAHAEGAKAAKLFQPSAEKYEYIIVASNNSKNGIPSQETMHYYEVMYDEVLSRFSIDLKRIYTAGFSGGSRVASSIAIYKGGISGVIGCSAGFPALNAPVEFKFDYIGFVGDEDMNYIEMMMLKDALDQSGYRHHLVVFHGPHEWPPVDVLSESFIWMEVNAMRDRKKPIDQEFIDGTINQWTKQAEAYADAKKNYDAYKMYQKLLTFFDGLSDLNDARQKVALLNGDPQVKKALEEAQADKTKEMELQTQNAKALQSEDINWWRIQIATMHDSADNAVLLSTKAMYNRLLGYLSLAAYSGSNGSLINGELNQAAHYIELYSVIDPENNEHAYMFAQLQAKLDNPNLSFYWLEKAYMLGFRDQNRFQTDTVFNRLKDDLRYQEFLDQLKKQD